MLFTNEYPKSTQIINDLLTLTKQTHNNQAYSIIGLCMKKLLELRYTGSLLVSFKWKFVMNTNYHLFIASNILQYKSWMN